MKKQVRFWQTGYGKTNKKTWRLSESCMQPKIAVNTGDCLSVLATDGFLNVHTGQALIKTLVLYYFGQFRPFTSGLQIDQTSTEISTRQLLLFLLFLALPV